ncbi:MAG: hypothetical protein IJE78_06090 [Bacteroidaceae bacterium]|nr:hypothetical protein [Bacteroidaceae bacterium]
MKKYISAASLPSDVKIDGKHEDMVEELYRINPDIFNGVSRVETYDGWKKNADDPDTVHISFWYGRKRGGSYLIPVDATDDELYEIVDDIYGFEYSMRYARQKELARTKNLAAAGKIKLTANALVSRLIKAEFGLSSDRDPSGRNAGWVYYPVDEEDEEEYDRFYNEEFLPFLDTIKKQYPDLSINSRLSGYGPMLRVYGPDYAWDKATRTATVLK